MAVDIHDLTASLKLHRVRIVGHDIGLMVAYAYAAQFPEATERVVLMDAFLPGIGNWKNVWLLRDLWHFHFYGHVPLALVKGRKRTYLEHFWNDFAADRKRSVPEADRRLYARAYAQSGAMRAGFEYFRNFERDAEDFARMGSTRLTMPLLVPVGREGRRRLPHRTGQTRRDGRPRSGCHRRGTLAHGRSAQYRDCRHKELRGLTHSTLVSALL
jgi:pimeloyl-ACP methyl ester carboxylesterase